MKNVNVKTPVATPTTTATPVDLLGAGAPLIGKTLVGIVVASVATAITNKLLKTGATQKKYEEVLKEFTAK